MSSTMTAVRARMLTTEIRTSRLQKAQSVRFDIEESPDYINEGKGWTREKAVDFLRAHDIDANVKLDGDFLRAKLRDAGRYLEMRNLAPGVEMILCEPRE